MEWISSILISTIANGLYASFSKISEFYYKPESIVLYINIITLIIMTIYSLLIQKAKLDYRDINIYVVVTGILFALNNFFLLEALNNNNNSGLVFSLVRSQFALTYLLSVIFLKNKIEPKKILYIGIIIVGCILLTKKNKKENFDKFVKNEKTFFSKNIWIFYTLMTILCFSFFDITTKKSLETVNIDSFPVYIMFIVVFVLLILNKLKGNSFILERKKKNSFEEFKINFSERKKKMVSLLAVMLGGFFFSIFYIYLNISIKKSTNPSEPKAILSLSLIIVSLFTFIFIKNQKIYRNFVFGAIILIIGVFLLAFSK